VYLGAAGSWPADQPEPPYAIRREYERLAADYLAEQARAVMLQVGDRVWVSAPRVPACERGDTGTVTLGRPFSGADYYAVQMDPPSAAGLVILRGDEIDLADP